MSHSFILLMVINFLLSFSGIFPSPRIWDKSDDNILSQICTFLKTSSLGKECITGKDFAY